VGGASVEITERVRAEEALQQYAARWQALSRQLIAAQEGERRRIARELHDQIGQALTAIKIDLQLVQRQAALGHAPDAVAVAPPPAVDARLEQSIALVERTIQQVREVSLDLRPSILDDLGLPSALLWYAEEQARRAGFQAELAIEQIETRLPPELEITCFRVAQEAITNIVRHAGARRAGVVLRCQKDTLILTISDDGIGFDPATLAAETARGAPAEGPPPADGRTGVPDVSRLRGLGLAGMHERMLLAGGQLTIESVPGAGTTVRAVFPLAAFPAPTPPPREEARHGAG
jgi:signal transduction histidine kinase